MKRIISSVLLIPALFICTITFSQKILMKASDPFFKFVGGATLTDYESFFEVQAFSDYAGGCPTLPCKVSASGINLQILPTLDIEEFRKAMFKGRMIREADLVKLIPTGKGFFEPFRIHMENIVVVSVSEGDDGQNTIIINVELKPEKMAWRTQELNNGKSTIINTSGYDFKAFLEYKYF